MKYLRMPRVPRASLFGRTGHQSERSEQRRLGTRRHLRLHPRPLSRQRKTRLPKRARRTGETSRRQVTTGVLLRRRGDTGQPPGTGATEPTEETEAEEEEEEDLPGNTRDHVAQVRLPNEDGTPDRPGNVAGILSPEVEVAPGTIVTDLAGGTRRLRDAGISLILVEDRAHRDGSSSSVDDPILVADQDLP